MKLTKLFAALTLTLALLAGGVSLRANCGQCPGEKKCESKGKCCEEAKKAGKTCDKCPKDGKKEEKK